MTQLLINYVNIVPTTILIRPGVSVSCPLLLVRLDAYIPNLSEFYSYRFIGKLTAFLHLQELCLHNQIVDFSTTVARLFLLCSNLGLEISLPRIQLYVLTSTLMDRQSRLILTLTLHSQTSRLLTSSLSLGVPVPRPTHCLRGV
jgi:hypothetical protein